SARLAATPAWVQLSAGFLDGRSCGGTARHCPAAADGSPPVPAASGTANRCSRLPASCIGFRPGTARRSEPRALRVCPESPRRPRRPERQRLSAVSDCKPKDELTMNVRILSKILLPIALVT